MGQQLQMGHVMALLTLRTLLFLQLHFKVMLQWLFCKIIWHSQPQPTDRIFGKTQHVSIAARYRCRIAIYQMAVFHENYAPHAKNLNNAIMFGVDTCSLKIYAYKFMGNYLSIVSLAHSASRCCIFADEFYSFSRTVQYLNRYGLWISHMNWRWWRSTPTTYSTVHHLKQNH
mgnify:CR=1 FL=1